MPAPRAAFFLSALIGLGVGLAAASPAPMAPPALDWPRADAPADNVWTADKAALGRRLFFEPILSSGHGRSCATCHDPGRFFQDGRPRGSALDGGALGRRTPHLADTLFDSALFWDGRAASLEAQALGPMLNPQEMAGDRRRIIRDLAAEPDYPDLFAKAFPGPKPLTLANVARALAAYERTLRSAPAPVDAWLDGDANALGPEATRGAALFFGAAGCATCHSGRNFSDGGLHDIGLPDADRGRGAVLKLTALDHAFKTPSLRGVAARAPYMHDGQLKTLADVVDHYATGVVQRPSVSPDLPHVSLDPGQRADLVAFLEALGDGAVVERPPTDPGPLTVSTDPLVIQKDKAFSAEALAIKAGTRVVFDNHDTRAHNVRVFEPGLMVDSGFQKPGVAFAVTFDKPGTYRVFCGIHPKMQVAVTVR